jgi:hypothetical protein
MKTVNELENELRVARLKEYETQRLAKLKAKEEFEKKNNISVYTSDDYCGMGCGRFQFYYGYEVTMCPIKSHKTDDDCYQKDCDKREWCFTADIDGKEVMKIPRSELLFDGDEPYSYLIAGIGKFLSSNLITITT